MNFKNTMNKLLICTIAVILILVGCQSLRYYIVKHKGLSFNHKRHLKEGLDCDTCHSKYTKEAIAGMPSFDDCNNCHSDSDKKKPPEKQITNFLVNGKPSWSKVTEIPDEIKFSHKIHYDAKVSCDSCHKGIKESEAVSSQLSLNMFDCLSCHKKMAQTNTTVYSGNYAECSVCHIKITKDMSPSSHDKSWKKFHGRVAKIGKGIKTQDNCNICHTQASCTKCHQDNPPDSHNNSWRYNGHGIVARVDRASCQVCHKTDYCQRCHDETAPKNHIGLWAGSGKAANTHCLTCHFPLNSQMQNCNVCHKSTPGHLAAPNKPGTPVHTTTNPADCRFCHSASLSHIDNPTIDCNICHN